MDLEGGKKKTKKKRKQRQSSRNPNGSESRASVHKGGFGLRGFRKSVIDSELEQEHLIIIINSK